MSSNEYRYSGFAPSYYIPIYIMLSMIQTIMKTSKAVELTNLFTLFLNQLLGTSMLSKSGFADKIIFYISSHVNSSSSNSKNVSIHLITSLLNFLSKSKIKKQNSYEKIKEKVSSNKYKGNKVVSSKRIRI